MGWRTKAAKLKAEYKTREAGRLAQYQVKKHETYLIRPLWLQKEEEDEEVGEKEPSELRGLRCHRCSVSAGENDNILNRLVGFLGNAAHSRQCCDNALTEKTFDCEFDTMEGLIIFGRTHVLVSGFTLWRFHRELAARGIWTLPMRTEAELAEQAAQKQQRREERISRKRSRGAASAATVLHAPVVAVNYEKELKTLCKKRAREFEHPTRAALATLRRSAVGGDAIEENAYTGRIALLTQLLPALPYDEDAAVLHELVYSTHFQATVVERFMYADYEDHEKRKLVIESNWDRDDAEMAAEGFVYSDNEPVLRSEITSTSGKSIARRLS
jgi:hypothetical protein